MTRDRQATARATIGARIQLIRGRRVLLSSDLADLYGVRPGALIQAVRRNAVRFPPDFMFRLTLEEARNLRSQVVTLGWGAYARHPPYAFKAPRSQFVTLKKGQNIKHPPYAFTEQGVAMLSSVLRSERAVLVNIAIMRAFVRLRGMPATNRELSGKLMDLEPRMGTNETSILALLAEGRGRRRRRRP